MPLTNPPPDPPDPVDAEAMAAAFRDAEPGDGHVPLPTERYPTLDWEGARAIAGARDDLRRAAGDRLVGYKLGWTSSAMREALGIEQPNWGTLWESQRIDETLARRELRHPKVEPEFVYVVGAPLRGRVTVDEVAAGAAGWAVGLEIVDPRFVDYGFRFLDNTADNSSAARYALGAVHLPPAGDPATWELAFADGTEERSGRGDVVMGSPLEAVAWLVACLDEEGRALRPGMIVFTGGITAPFDLVRGRTYVAASEGVGEVAFTVG